MKNQNLSRVVASALFAAIICVATFIVQIPSPATGGYINLDIGLITAAVDINVSIGDGDLDLIGFSVSELICIDLVLTDL